MVGLKLVEPILPVFHFVGLGRTMVGLKPASRTTMFKTLNKFRSDYGRIKTL